MSGHFLSRMADGLPIKSVDVAMDGSGKFQYHIQ